MYVKWWGVVTDDPKAPLLMALEYMNMASYVLLALTEFLVAYVLLVVSGSAVKSSEVYCGGGRVGLFERMMVSAEIRVATLAPIGITRAAASKVEDTSDVAYGFHMYMWTFQHLYTMVLIVDLLMTKLAVPGFVKVDETGTHVVGHSPSRMAQKRSNGEITFTTFDESVVSRRIYDTKEHMGTQDTKIEPIVSQTSSATV